MKRRQSNIALSLCLLAATTLSACSMFSKSGASPARASGWKPESLVREKVTFTPPRPERWQLPNGVSVIYRFDDELPSVRATFYLPGGTLVSGEKTGVPETTGTMMRDGGIRGMAPEALDKALDDLAAGVESNYGATYGTVACSSLKEDFAKVFGYATEVIRHPGFDAKRFELWKKNTHQAIDRRRDNPGLMASFMLTEQIFGKDSPYARFISHARLDAISIDDLRKFHAKFVHPRGTLLVVTGAIPKDELNALLEKTIGDWETPAGALDPNPLPPVPGLGKPGVYVLERDFDQSTVLMGHIGPPLPNPEIPEIGVFNRLYGSGGFSNVLMQEIRTKLGLAYGVAGAISPGIGAGMFEVELATRNDEVIRAIEKVLEVTNGTLARLPAAADLEGAKSSVERAFIFKFESPDQVTNRAAQQELLKFPADYDERYLGKVEAITPETAADVGKRWIKPQHLAIVVVGRVSAEKFAAAFSGRGIPVFKVAFDELPRIVGEVSPQEVSAK